MITEKTRHLMIVAGETSGDMHAAHLVKEIKKLNPQITFSGLGGAQMAEAGVELYEDLTKLAVVGFVEVLKHYALFKNIFYAFLQKVQETKPDAVILVDYPGFNIRLAKELKKKNIKTIYYISPQVWAWKENRVQTIKENVDKMLVLFEFEKIFYAQRGVKVEFVGHPLIDSLNPSQNREQFCEEIGIDADRLTIGILPGSRQREVETLLPMMMRSVVLLSNEYPRIQFLIVKAPTINTEFIEKQIPKVRRTIKIIDNNAYNAMNACNACIVASGTATLETAILEKPMVVVYKTSLLTWLLAKLFIKIPDIGLVNVVAGKRIVPECVQFQAKPQNIAHEMKIILTSEPKIAEIKIALQKVKSSLGESGASQRAAKSIFQTLYSSPSPSI